MSGFFINNLQLIATTAISLYALIIAYYLYRDRQIIDTMFSGVYYEHPLEDELKELDKDREELLREYIEKKEQKEEPDEDVEKIIEEVERLDSDKYRINIEIERRDNQERE